MDLSTGDFYTIRNIIKDHSGIFLPDTKKNFLRVRLNHRLKVTGMETAKEYYYFLKYDYGRAQEINALIDAATVNETYFYRDETQLIDFIEEVLPIILSKNHGFTPLTIWSAGCSTGDEPYTLAILLKEYTNVNGGNCFNILGTDISQTMLKSAREGLYDSYSIRYLPPVYLLKYFDKTADNRVAINTDIKSMVKFAHINLMDPLATCRLHDMDCIFCRNVIIYFDDDDKRKCLDHLYRCLKKGGYLFLGHSESLGRISRLFEVVHLKQTICYKKPE